MKKPWKSPIREAERPCAILSLHLPEGEGRVFLINFIYLCILLFFIFVYNNTLFHIYIQRKSYKNCRKVEKKVAKFQFPQ